MFYWKKYNTMQANNKKIEMKKWVSWNIGEWHLFIFVLELTTAVYRSTFAFVLNYHSLQAQWDSWAQIQVSCVQDKWPLTPLYYISGPVIVFKNNYFLLALRIDNALLFLS